MSDFKIDTKKHFNKIAIAAVVGLAIGIFLLEDLAKREKMPLGQTFYILTGCALIAVSGIILLAILKKRFFPKKKKRRKSSRPVFLKDVEKNNSQQKTTPPQKK